VPPHEIFGFFGIAMEMFERVYGHHHPDYQSKAVNALSRARQIPNRIAVNETRQDASNIIKVAGKR